jgi:hypothetical protein
LTNASPDPLTVQIMVDGMVARLEEMRITLPLSNVDAVMVAVGVVRRIVATIGIDIAPLPGPQRDALYEVVFGTITNAMREDAASPPER